MTPDEQFSVDLQFLRHLLTQETITCEASERLWELVERMERYRAHVRENTIPF